MADRAQETGAPGPVKADAVPQDVLFAALEKAPVGAVLVSTEDEWRILYINAEFSSMTGYSPADIPTVTDWLAKAYPDPAYHEMVAANWAVDSNPENMGREVVYRVRCANGSDRDLQFRASTLGEQHMFVAAVDVTERERSLRALQNSEEKYSNLFHVFPHAIFVHDLEGHIFDANQTACDMLGYSLDDMLSLRISALHPPEALPVCREAFEAVGKTGRAAFNVQFRRKDGSLVHAAVAAAVFSASGRDLVQAVVIDMTERDAAETARRQLEERLRHSQKMEAIGELAGGVAHDFNNMLTVILGNAELLGMEQEGGSEGARLVEQIVSASRRAADLTSQLLTLARRGEQTSERVDMHRVVREVEALLLHGIDRQITIKLDLKATHPCVTGDPSSLETSVLNLGLNARDAIDGAGRISITTADRTLEQEAPEIAGSALKPGDYFELTVADTGCGMGPDVVSRVFEPFFTTKSSGLGTGLGLATVYGCVTGIGGAVTVESAEGEGSTFHVLLPVASRGAAHTVEESPPAPRRGSGHILVVDDEELVRDFVATAMRSLGYQVSTAVDGVDAVRVFKAHHDDIDLVVLDLVMPRMGGKQAFQELLAVDPNVRVLVSSGYAQDATSDELLAAGVRGFLSKPYRIDELARKLAMHVSAD